MIEVDERNALIVRSASGLLREANRAGLIGPADVHVATTIGSLTDEDDERVLLAIALTVAAVGHGAICVDLRSIADDAAEFTGWPETEGWLQAVVDSRAVASGVVVIDEGLLYLDRYHRLESQVCAELQARSQLTGPAVDQSHLTQTLARVFPPSYAEQRAAAELAASQWTTVITGGPGTGKTTAVAGLLTALLSDADARGDRLSVALTAPTGKAAARLQESIASELADTQRFTEVDRARLSGVQAMTLHRLLGWRRDNQTRFRHDRHNKLKYDVVVVDEASMVDLTMMARLLEALRPQARLILVGDADQLASVAAGAVLTDLVNGYANQADSPVASLTTAHRYGEEIGALAESLRRGDADAAVELLRAGGQGIEWLETDDAAEALHHDLLSIAQQIRASALAGDHEGAIQALDEHRLICAHREGPHGVSWWNRLVEQWLAEAEGVDYWPRWYAGRPLLITRNDRFSGLFNGETGVAVANDGGLRGWIQTTGGLRDFATTRLSEIETMHALTVHKSQGSQVRRVTVLLPPEDSRLLSRELFYTAVTRAKEHVRVVGSEAEVRAAIERTAARATGLAARLTASGQK